MLRSLPRQDSNLQSPGYELRIVDNFCSVGQFLALLAGERDAVLPFVFRWLRSVQTPYGAGLGSFE